MNPAAGQTRIAAFRCPYDCGAEVALAYSIGSDGATVTFVAVTHQHIACGAYIAHGVEVGRWGLDHVLPMPQLAMRRKSTSAVKGWATRAGDIIGLIQEIGDVQDGTK